MMYETYSKLEAIHYSGLKTFSKCPKLYKEKYITKTYIEPDCDYFLYGHLVDCLITEPETLSSRFVKVSKRSNGSTLDLEVKMSVLEAEVAERQVLAAAGNKSAIKGIASRQLKIEELKAQIKESKSFGDLEQVPSGIWNDAHETALAIQGLPLYDRLIADGWTCASQWVMQGHEGCERKGMIDRLYIKDKQAIIEDIKTTRDLTLLDPTIYAGQLAYYKYIVEENGYEVLDCYASVGDKTKRSLAQDFRYSVATLESALSTVLATESLLLESIATNNFPSAKSLRGREQTCFSCSECSVRPFSTDEPITV